MHSDEMDQFSRNSNLDAFVAVYKVQGAH